jgi:hypothetical protein
MTGQFLTHSIMVRLFTIAVALLTLAHSIFGCCLHHAHSAPVTCSRGAALEAGLVIVCDAHPAAVDLHCRAGHSHHHSPTRCNEEPCNFARTEAEGADAAQDSGLAWRPLTTGSVSRTSLEYLQNLARNDIDVAAAPLSLTSSRSHLALSILLV